MSIINYTATGQMRILGRSLRFWIILAIAGIVALTVLTTFLGNALIRVSYTLDEQAKKGNVTLTRTTSSDVEPLSFLFDNYALVPRDTKSLKAATDDSETSLAIESLPYFEIPEFSLTLKPQNKLSKLFGQTRGCNMLTKNGAFTYPCTNMEGTSRVQQPVNGAWENKQVINQDDSLTFTRYKDGFLALYFPVPEQPDNTPPRLDYIDAASGTVIRELSLPQGFTKSNEDSLLLSVDPTAKNLGAVVANLTTGKFAYIKNLSQPNDIVQFDRKAQKESDAAEGTACALLGTKFVCYYSRIDDDHMGIEENPKEKPPLEPGTFQITDLTVPNNTKTYNSPVPMAADEIFIGGAGSIFALGSDDALYKFAVKNDAMTHRVIANQVTIAKANTSVYYISNEKLYEYVDTENTAYLRYRSKHLRVANLSIYKNDVLIDAYANVSQESELLNVTYAFKLSDQAVTPNEKRVEDILPYDDTKLPMTYMDYNDAYIYVVIPPELRTNPTNGTTFLDKASVASKREQIRQQLEKDGVLQGRQLLVFSGE